MTYQIAKGDYVKFTRVVTPKVTQRVRDSVGGNHDAVLSDRFISERSGSGYVVSVRKSTQALPVGAPDSDSSEKVLTGRVDAGPLLGTVTAVLDDAILIGKQQSLNIDIQEEIEAGMYSQDVKGGA